MASRCSGVFPFDTPLEEDDDTQQMLIDELMSKYSERDIHLVLNCFMEQNEGTIPQTRREFDEFYKNMQGSVAGLKEDAMLFKDQLRLANKTIRELEQQKRQLLEEKQQTDNENKKLKKQIQNIDKGKYSDKERTNTQ